MSMKRLKENIKRENIILLKKLKALPDNEKDKALRYKELLLKNNDGLIHQIINDNKRYLCTGFEYQDAEQVCRMMLMRCIDKYEEHPDATFSGYIAICMKAAIMTEYKRNANKIHIPFDKSKTYADRYEYVNTDDVAYIEDDDEILVEDTIRQDMKEPDASMAYKEMREKIISAFNDALSPLTAKETMCMILRFGLDGGKELTLDEIGRRLDITGSRVHQIIAKAECKLRCSMRRHGLKDFMGTVDMNKNDAENLMGDNTGNEYVNTWIDKQYKELKSINEEYEREDIEWER